MPAWLSRLIRDYHPIDQSKIWKLPGPSYINRSYNPDPELETPSGQTYVNRGKRKGWWAGKIKLLDGLASDRPWMYGPKIKARAKKSEQQIVLLPQMLCLVMNNLDQVTGNQVWQTRLLLQNSLRVTLWLGACFSGNHLSYSLIATHFDHLFVTQRHNYRCVYWIAV